MTLAYTYGIDYRSSSHNQFRDNAFPSNAPSATRFVCDGSQTPTAGQFKASSDQSEPSSIGKVHVKMTCRTCEGLHGLVNNIITELQQLQTDISGVVWKQPKAEHEIYVVWLQILRAKPT